ncbi:hypothetical protein STAS_16920 [Striga asiatica]|uniref:Uncharacterized protein n=1 Tax=Striga asiatica TaxID=4170 RepID=A0A5A7Q723_STRAF|nr:hypothetical protein STAS_16920 [Striga asiatica]
MAAQNTTRAADPAAATLKPAAALGAGAVLPGEAAIDGGGAVDPDGASTGEVGGAGGEEFGDEAGGAAEDGGCEVGGAATGAAIGDERGAAAGACARADPATSAKIRTSITDRGYFAIVSLDFLIFSALELLFKIKNNIFCFR